MSLSQIGLSVKASPTLALNERAAILREKGDPVIHLGGGEPKSKVPIDALVNAAGLMNTGEVRYTPAEGIRSLKAAIIRYTEEFYGRKVSPMNVMASGGAKQAIMVAMQAMLNPHEEVVYPAPYWVSYPEMARLCQARGVPVLPEDGSFHPTLHDMEERVGSYTRVVILNSPNNPTGVAYSKEFVGEVVDFCERRGLWLIIDDIYHRLIFDGRTPANPFEFEKLHGENSKIVVVNGVSKQYAMTGFRIGWAVGPKKLIEVMTNIQSHQTSGPSVLLQHAAVGALAGSQSSVESLRLFLQNNRDFMLERLATFDNVKVTRPDGTFYCFADFSAYDKDSARLAKRLLDKVQVVTVPGIEFGLDGFLRLSFCGPLKEIKEGIERMKWVLDPNAPRELFIGDRKLVRDWT